METKQEGKKEIRNRILKVRKQISEENREEYSRKIAKQVLASSEFQKADCIFCYLSTSDEVSTKALIEEAWKEKKRVCVPLVIGEHEMEFHYIEDWKNIQPGYRGIFEPVVKNPVRQQNGLMLIPGIAFDQNGNRIGYGKGFYDNYLRKYPALKRMALAFSVQVVEGIPVDLGDVPMDILITEKGMKCL